MQASDLKNITLKKATVPKTSPTLKQQADIDKKLAGQLDVIYNRVREADLDFWYDALQEFTYKTLFLDLSVTEGTAMMEQYKASLKSGKQDVEAWPQILKALASRVDKVVQDFPSKQAFAKLSSRSPKDATLTSEKTLQIYKDIMKTAKTHDENTKLIAVYRAHIKGLMMTSGTQALATLLNSERIYEDLTLAFEHPDKWSQKIVLREFVDVPIEYEYRGFVVDGKLTCMCQYYHFAYFEHLHKDKDKIEKMVTEFFDSLKDKVPLTEKTYVIDFAMDLPNNKVYLIEINPFGKYIGMGTSTAMFDMQKDEAILFGRAGWEFRMETKPPTNILPLCNNAMRALLETKLQE